MRRDTEAVRDVRRALAASPRAQRGYVLANVALVTAVAGDSAGAGAALDSALATASLEHPTPRSFVYAAALGALRRTDEALRLLEAIHPRGAWLWSYLILTEFGSLRGDPRFQRLVEEARPPGAPRLP